MLSSRELDHTIEDAIASVGSAIQVLDVALVSAASNVSLAIDQMTSDHREHQRYAEILTGIFIPNEDGPDRTLDVEATIERGKRSSAALLALSETLRSSKVAISGASMAHGICTGDLVNVRQARESARESERSRLAREIHDGPAQVLANALFVVGVAERTVLRDPGAVPSQLSMIRDLLQDGIAEIRRFMFDLRPSMLEDQGLVETLRYYASEYSRVFGTQVSLTIDDHVPILPGEQELCVFRIVQEALQNIQKHANVRRADISIHSRDRWLVLEIADAGRGFDAAPREGPRGTGVGLRGMRERASLIGADFIVDSVVGGGTRIQLSIPVSTVAKPDPVKPDGLGQKGGK